MWSVCEKILLSRSEIKSLQIMDLRDIQYVKYRAVHHALAAAAQKTAFCVTDMFSLLFYKCYPTSFSVCLCDDSSYRAAECVLYPGEGEFPCARHLFGSYTVVDVAEERTGKN